jgi:hypothetical protein
MGQIKGKTSRKLLGEHGGVSKDFWGNRVSHLWARTTVKASSGKIPDEVIRQYRGTQYFEKRALDGNITIAP